MNMKLKGLTVATAALFASLAGASSHREAPAITLSPKVDGTDFYLFRSYDPVRSNYTTLIANYSPLQDAYGGPNYFSMDPDALYEIHIDNSGDSIEDLTFQFRFTNNYAQANIPSLNVVNGRVQVTGGPAAGVQVPLVNIGGGNGANTGALNVTESYTVGLVRGARRGSAAVLLSNVAGGSTPTVFAKPVDNIGTKSIPNYPGYAAKFIYEVNIPGCTAGPGKLFVGQRKEGFVVNLGTIFDQINTSQAPVAPGVPRNAVANTIGDKNITSLALEVPTSCLTNGSEPVIGGWTTASLRQSRVLNPVPGGPVATGSLKGPAVAGGAWTQVSRLGSPLVNEVVIGITDKDKFNASEPKNDVTNFGTYVLYPTLPVLVNVLFGVTPPLTTATAGRGDLLAAFVTGIRTSVNNANIGVAGPGNTMVDFTHPKAVDLTSLAGSGEMLRLNTAFPATPTAAGSQSDMGVVGCDLGGFPNGRRPGDDVVDIELTVLEGRLDGFNGLQYCDLTVSPPKVTNPGSIVTDASQPSPNDYKTVFPYLNDPIPGAQ